MSIELNKSEYIEKMVKFICVINLTNTKEPMYQDNNT